MRLLWAYEHDFAAISPFLSQRIGTLCRHPCRSLWLERRIAGWCSRRSEGDSKSLSAGYVPTDLLLYAVTSAGVGPLCFIKSKVNAPVYQEILEHFMLPSADKLYGDADFLFQQDFSTCPQCQNYFQVVC